MKIIFRDQKKFFFPVVPWWKKKFFFGPKNFLLKSCSECIKNDSEQVWWKKFFFRQKSENFPLVPPWWKKIFFFGLKIFFLKNCSKSPKKHSEQVWGKKLFRPSGPPLANASPHLPFVLLIIIINPKKNCNNIKRRGSVYTLETTKISTRGKQEEDEEKKRISRPWRKICSS